MPLKLLLDTHIFLWFIIGDKRLPDFMKESIHDTDNKVWLSVVSLWEVIIKNQLGKLVLPEPPEIYLPGQRRRHKISSLSLNESGVSQLAKLPSAHNDPFDRMLICQALYHGLTIVTVDKQICNYPIPNLKLLTIK